MSSNVAISVENISKCYEIYRKPHDRLLQMLHQGRRKYFQEFWALRNISFKIGKGETVGIVGKNGSGKSTLLQILAGTVNPTLGQVKVNGKIAALLELGSGFNGEFSGIENIYLSGSLMGLSKAEIDSQLDGIISFADIGEFINQPVKTYSSGMYVRLAFSLYSQVNPEILIVDEALAVGDEKFQRKCFGRMEELKDQGSAILFVSHSSSQISELCDRAILLDGGEQLLLDVPLKVIRGYQRLLYAPSNEIEVLREAFKNGSGQDGDRELPINSLTEPVIKNKESSAYFDPNLTSSSTQEYPSQGAEILEVLILDELDEVVNVLVRGNTYSISIKGKCNQNLENVYFGFHFRSISGIEVTGQRYPAQGKTLKRILAGSYFSVKFHIELNLLNEYYFLGCGIWSIDEPLCIHRMLDKLIVRIINNIDEDYSFGYVDAGVAPPKFSLSMDQ